MISNGGVSAAFDNFAGDTDTTGRGPIATVTISGESSGTANLRHHPDAQWRAGAPRPDQRSRGRHGNDHGGGSTEQVPTRVHLQDREGPTPIGMSPNGSGGGGSGIEQFTESDSIPNFTASHGDLSFNILPRFSRGKTRWSVQIVTEEGRIIYESMDGVTDDAIEEFDLPESLCDRLNEARAFAERKIDLFPIQGNRDRAEHPVSALEAVMD